MKRLIAKHCAFFLVLLLSLLSVNVYAYNLENADYDFVMPSEGNELSSPDVLVGATSGFSINKEKLTLYLNEATRLKVNGTDEKAIWSSSDRSVVRVTGYGTVRAVGLGTALVQARVGEERGFYRSLFLLQINI